MIRVVIPFYQELETVKPGLRDLRKSGVTFDVFPVQGPLIMNNRNMGVNNKRSQAVFQNAVEPYSHFLFIDSDIGFEARHVTFALRAKKPIVAMPYLRHENDGLYQAGDFETFDGSRIVHAHSDTCGLLEVDFVGAGFLLVERDVFLKMRYPWFRHSVHEIECEDGSLIAENTGEDVEFCKGARAVGVPIFCDFDHPVHHRLRRPEDFDVRA